MVKLKTLLAVMALLSLIWGVGFILLPEQMWSMYGLTLDSGGIYMSRELGTIFFMLGMILWLSRKDTGSQALRAIVFGLFVGNTIGGIVSLVGQLSAGINALGWVAVATYFVMAVGFGYFLIKPLEAVARARQA